VTANAQPAPLAFSTAFGLIMVASIAAQAHGAALVTALLSALAVLIGIRFRSIATLAVLLTMAAMVLSDSPALLAALSGLAAAAYLVLRHAAGLPGLATATQSTVVAAMTFTVAGLAATAFSWRLPWMPLVAPIVVFTIYAVVTRPFWTKPSNADHAE
jgi:hypothetical protein